MVLPSLWLSPAVTLAAMATRSASWAEGVVVETDKSEVLLESLCPELSKVQTIAQQTCETR